MLYSETPPGWAGAGGGQLAAGNCAPVLFTYFTLETRGQAAAGQHDI